MFWKGGATAVDPHKKPIFLFSLPRSGSTLLQRILMSSSQISSVAEPWILLPFCSMFEPSKIEMYSSYSTRVANQAVGDFIKTLKNEKLTYNEALREFVSTLYSSSGDVKGGSGYFLDKTPRYYLIIDQIADIFPDAKFIFLVRNPLDVFSSCMSTWWNGKLWINHQHIDLFAGPKFLQEGYEKHAHRSFKMSYEDLVSRPESSMKELCLYLDIEFTYDLLHSLPKEIATGQMGDKTGIEKYNKIANESVKNWSKGAVNLLRKHYLKRYINHLGHEVCQFFGLDKDSTLRQIDRLKNTYDHLLLDAASIFASHLVRRCSAKVNFNHLRLPASQNHLLD